MMNKYFYDPDHSIPYNTVNTDCRKVISYMYVEGQGDRFDNADSYHGTHVSGSVGGTVCLFCLKYLNGMHCRIEPVKYATKCSCLSFIYRVAGFLLS